MMSSSTRSYGAAARASSACFPFSATATWCPSARSRRASRSRFISVSSTTRRRPGAVAMGGVRREDLTARREQLPQIGNLFLRGALSLLDHVRNPVGVEEVNLVLELRNDRQNLVVV